MMNLNGQLVEMNDLLDSTLIVAAFYKELSPLSVVLERKAKPQYNSSGHWRWQMLDTGTAECTPDTVWQILIKLPGQGTR